MITINGLDGAAVQWGVTVSRVKVYLDTDAISALAEDKYQPRDRFVAAIRRGGSLCFSETGAMELGARLGSGAEAVQGFLHELGNLWLPLLMNPFKAIEREDAGRGLRAGISEDFFIERFFRQRLADLSNAAIVNLDSEYFFDLAEVVRWSQQDREGIRETIDRFDDKLRSDVERFHASGLQPNIAPFDPQHRARFMTENLIAILVREAKSHAFKRNDSLDFCHAAIGCAYSDVLALDKHWKRRIGLMPRADVLPRCFYKNELPDLVTHLEALIAQREQGQGPAPVSGS